MAYTDIELSLMARVAYFDLDDAYASLEADRKETSFTISELIAASWDELPDNQRHDYKNLSEAEKTLLNEWRISKVYDDNRGKDATGFYACVIETDQGGAVSFRGSEDMTELEHLVKDWFNADIGLLNSTMTTQQGECDTFLSNNKDFLDQYKNITFVGHSLGGNLAEYATIMSGEYGLDDNITDCYSLDGPGHSNEFIYKYKPNIEKMSGKMHHYSASAVGRLLNPLPGVVNLFIDANGSGFDRHTMSNWTPNPDGKFEEGIQDALSQLAEQLSQGIDKLPAWMGDLACDFVCVLWYSYSCAKQNFFVDGALTTEGALLFAALIATCKVSIPIIATVVTYMVAFILGVAIVGLVLECVIETVKHAVKIIGDFLISVWNWTVEMVTELCNMIVEEFEKVSQWYNSTFNDGYKYATANPSIVVDTYKLYSYSNRLDSINRRISDLDSRLNSLYWSVCDLENLLGTANALWNLIQADALTSYSFKLRKCSSYLENTAEDFEKAEKKVLDKAH